MLAFKTFPLLLIVICSAKLSLASTDAQWIWSRDALDGDPASPASRLSFLRQFHLPETDNSTSCGISISIGYPYHLFVNGDLVGSGHEGVSGPADNSTAKQHTATLRPGINVFALNTTGNEKWDSALLPPSPGLLVDITIPRISGNGEAGDVEKLVSDPSWRVSLKIEPGFEKLGFDHSQWEHAAVVEHPREGQDIGIIPHTLGNSTSSSPAPNVGLESGVKSISPLETSQKAIYSPSVISDKYFSTAAVGFPTSIPESSPLTEIPDITSTVTVTLTQSATAPNVVSTATVTSHETTTIRPESVEKIVKKQVVKKVRVVNGIRSTALQTSVTTEFLTTKPTQTSK